MFTVKFNFQRRKKLEKKKEGEKDFPVKLARKTLEKYLQEGKKINLPAWIPDIFKKKAGVFVSLHKKGKLRGCIGTFLPAQPDITREIINNAISAATKDPRFLPVEKQELKEIDISVDILSQPKKTSSLEELNPQKYGIIISKGWQRGLLLPNLKGVDTIEYQVKIAKQKAGLSDVPTDKLTIQRFTVKRYKKEK